MSIRVFDGDDQIYQAWLLKNPHGFVANTVRDADSSYFTVHHATCRLISQYNKMARLGGFTERSYIKVASLALDELLRWGRKNRALQGGRPKNCSKCTPLGRHQQPGKRPRRGVASTFPDEVDPRDVGLEGGVTQVFVNRFERDPKSRAACLRHFGFRCRACGIDFEKFYGRLGKHFIHVHHLVPLAQRRKSYRPDPIKHLVPVCPNCHAMLHQAEPPKTVATLKKLILQARREKDVGDE